VRQRERERERERGNKAIMIKSLVKNLRCCSSMMKNCSTIRHMSSINHIQTSKNAPLDGIQNSRAWLKESDCVLQDLIDVVEGSKTHIEHYPLATESIGNAVVYDRDRFVDNGSKTIPSDVGRALEREMMHVFKEGPGIVVIRGAWYDLDVVDECTKVFKEIIQEERASGEAAGDHFGKPGANSRIWNAHEKLAVKSPDVYVRYYANDVLPIVGRAWLGPNYQVTAQVNIVHPGGEAQQAHRDYHLGFMENDMAERFPAHVHGLAAAMTLQGAVAHCDMPVESGPTEYLPHSHKYEHGYLAYRDDGFAEYFKKNYVQLPLSKGDAVFFNPALLHAAGDNKSSDIDRVGNLLQLSSAFGRSMETVDRARMCKYVYPTLLEYSETFTKEHVENVIMATAEGYSFPTNLDFDQPIGGLAPASQADMLRGAISKKVSFETFMSDLNAHTGRRASHK